MSWFDTTGFTSLAKSALKEAQRTIDKALDIEENNENEVPTATLGVTSASTHKGLSEKLKDESEHFFASFGLEKKKSPLTPVNSPVDTIPANTTTKEYEECPVLTEDAGGKPTSSAMVSSLWGSFTGSFFENPATDKQQIEDGADKVSRPKKDIVATQPPRSSTSLPSLQLASSPVSTQPRTASLDGHQDESAEHRLCQRTDAEDSEMQDPSSGSVEGGTSEWGWGWESSIMIMSGDQQQLEGDANSSHAELDSREDILADDLIDVEGFARSRLVVGSVDSDSSGFMRQESQGSLCGKSVELDVPFPITEDVFDAEQDAIHIKERTEEHVSMQTSSESRLSSTNQNSKVDVVERRTTVSNESSEVHTPESIVILTSDNSSPDGDVSSGSLSTASKTKLSVSFTQGNLTSPISSPESIEVLGSRSIVTSPSSIEVLSGLSSSDSSPTHQDSCSNTLTQDLSPPPNPVISTQPTVQLPPVNPPLESLPQQTTETPKPLQDIAAPDVSTTDRADTRCKESRTEEPISQDMAMIKEEGKECVTSPIPIAESSPAPKESDISSRASSSLLEDMSASESIHSTSTSSTHTVLDGSMIHTDNQAVPGHLDALPLDGSGKIQEDVDAEGDTAKDKKTVSLSSVANTEGGGSETPEGTVPAVSLDMSVESGGSSDTITASVDSSQMGWSWRSPGGGSEQEQQEVSGLQESTMTGSGGSVVRCLLEEAMGDEEATCEASPPREHSPSSSERSEALKVGSGHTSGHSSGDEIETTTSSDIEVISSPSLDGSTVARGSAATTRVWTSAQRGLRSFLNDGRSESPASDSSSNNKKVNNDKAETVPSSMTTSFTSISESEGESFNPLVPGLGNLFLDPSHISQVLLQDMPHFDKGHRRNQSNFSETSESSSEPHSPEVDKLLKKISQLSEVLEVRETKLMELSQVNAALQDTNLRFKARVEELEGGRGAEATESLREEFTQRLATMERKFQQALREKEATKKQLEEVRAEAATRLSATEVAKELEERDTTIQELRIEGEKLSKQQLNYSNIVKKLRGKEKENETTIKTQKDKLEEQSRELDRLRKQLSAKEEMERRQIDAVCQLNVTNQRLETMLRDTNAENAELEGKMAALKSALDTAYREMADLQRAAATKDAEVQEQALSAEVGARKQLEATLTEAQAQARREQEALMAQVLELQDALSRAESQANRKERQLRADISELQQRVSEAEARAEELSGAVSAATRPLLRQMENLQSTHATQQATWETLENTLTRRLNEAQSAAATSSEKERATREQYAEMATSAAGLQTQVANLRAENAKLTSQLDLLSSKMDSLTDARTKETTQVEALKTSFAEEVREVKRERDCLDQQLDIEKTALSAEKKKTAALQEQLKDRERKLLQAANGMHESHPSTPRSSPTPSLSRLSVSGSLTESFSGSQWGEEVFESGWARGASLYDSIRGNVTSTVEVLTSQLRQREGEVHHLQSEITRHEAQRESLAQELVLVTTQVEALQSSLQDHETLQKQYKDMEQKYNALLQMHGEKVEEVEELRLDLEDVKEMYKAQIDQLLQK